MKPFRLFPIILLILAAGSAVAGAKPLALHAIFTDHMVLQRDKPAVIRGFAPAGSKVEVTFAGQTRHAVAQDDGVWRVALDAMAASRTPQSLTVASGGDKVVIQDVLVGDVILHARQTSVDISLGRDKTGQQAAATDKKNPQFRAISIDMIPAAEPLDDLAPGATSGWTVVDRASALEMTASAYYLGRDLTASVDAPIGIIDLNMGHAYPNSWLSREALMETGKFFNDVDSDEPDDSVARKTVEYEQRLQAELKDEPVGNEKTPPKDVIHHPLFPYAGYRGTLLPLAGTALKAVVLQVGNDYPYIYYQKLLESDDPFNKAALNEAYAVTYDLRKWGYRMEPVTVPRIPREWRKVLGEDLPIGLIVPPGSDLNTLGQHHREMRELQRLAAEDTPGVDLIMPGTQHLRFSSQPADASLLASRSLSWLEGAVYKKPNTPATGPLFDRFEGNFNEAILHFKAGTAQGLQARGDALDYFEAAGVVGDYSPVQASIDGETIRLVSDTVTRIARVRYNWNQHPNQGLSNAAGLPAIPFRSELAPYDWLPKNEEDELPAEYFTPANEWSKSEITLINVQLEAGEGYPNFTGWIGPAGFKTAPFGPNMGVKEIKAGSPAEGRLRIGDVIYSANGNMLGEKAWEVMAAAVTEAETREGGGKLMLGIRRGTQNIDVELILEVMGTYSPTAPFDCPKTEKIIADLEQWLVSNDAGAGFLNSDALFLLATGNPELQGYVRRAVYKILEDQIKPGPLDGRTVGRSWYNSADALLLGEYYLATGDKNVLPHLKYACDKLAASQQPEGGWRHNYPGGFNYGYISVAGLPGVMGMHFAKEAGVPINLESFELGVHHYKHQRAETGIIIYGKGQLPRPIPDPFDPEDVANGTVGSMNGALSAAGILMEFVGDHRSAHLCSLMSTYSYNHTHDGHGGNFWNNFWTPLGAHQHSKKASIHFWKNHRWYRECSRMFDGSLIGGGRPTAGYGVALVAPRRRIQIVGAPASPFATSAPAALKPALEAYWSKAYAACEQLVGEIIDSGAIGNESLPTARYLARAADEMLASIEADLARMKALIDAGDLSAALSFLPGLQAVTPSADPRLLALQQRLRNLEQALKHQQVDSAGGSQTRDNIDIDLAHIKRLIDAGNRDEAITYLNSLQAAMVEEDARLVAMAKRLNEDEPQAEPEAEPREWVRLVMENPPTQAEAGQANRAPAIPEVVSQPDQPNVWRLNVLESINQAPEGWFEPKFDDSSWSQTGLPISWRMYHTSLLRTSFQVDDKSRFDGLRLHSWILRQQQVRIYLNGELIAKINGAGNSTNIQAEFKESAVKHLKNGENTLAITTRHNWRWGHRDMFAYNGGFDFNIDARLKK